MKMRLVALALLVSSAPAWAECLKSVDQLQQNKVKTKWVETTANDGKPLTISIADGTGGLVFTAIKDGQTWLTGDVSICVLEKENKTQFTLENTKATRHVPLLARMMLPSKQAAQIVDDQIKLGGAAWGGTFIAR